MMVNQIDPYIILLLQPSTVGVVDPTHPIMTWPRRSSGKCFFGCRDIVGPWGLDLVSVSFIMFYIVLHSQKFMFNSWTKNSSTDSVEVQYMV
jgi:hypothetical protein